MDVAGTLRCLKEMPLDVSIMLRAMHGVGKSSIVKQHAKREGVQFHDIRLSQNDVGDVKGFPNPNTAEGIMEFLKAYWWPRDMESKGILLFDELNRAKKDVQQAVFEICLDRRLDGVPLPPGWRVVACINADPIYQVTPMDVALEDRWFMIDFEPTVQDWLDWATSNGVHPAVIQYIDSNRGQLDPPIANMEPGKIYPSRRSWEFLSATMQSMNLLEENDQNGFFTEVAVGWVGTLAGPSFVQWAVNNFKTLSPRDVLLNLPELRSEVEEKIGNIEIVGSLSNGVLREFQEMDLSVEDKEVVIGNLRSFFLMVPPEISSNMWGKLFRNNRTRAILTKAWKDDKEVMAKVRQSVSQ
jgi:hypothetical protein